MGIFSFLGDYWFTSYRAAESVTSSVGRWFCCCKRQVSSPEYNLETWEHELLFRTVDEVNASVNFVTIVSLVIWQVVHGANLTWGLATLAIAVISWILSGSMWKCTNDRTNPRRIWWFNFFHFNWHLWANISLCFFYTDFCRNGVRGISWSW